MSRKEMTEFYDTLQTVPKLIGDLAISIAEAQRRLDQDYMENLAAFSKVVLEAVKDQTAEQYLTLFKAIAPSRYQFTETVAEVRADLQMTRSSELGISIGGTLFAFSINASYTRRSGYDYRAAALIRTVMNAVPADPGVLEKLLERGGTPPTTTLPGEMRYKALAEASGSLPKLPAGGGGGD